MIIVQKIKPSVAKADARLLDRVRGLQHTVEIKLMSRLYSPDDDVKLEFIYFLFNYLSLL